MDNPQPESFFARHEFLIRRLHSLSGLIPVGAYMSVHLLTNATVLGGSEFFQQQVDQIHKLGPALPIIEWTFIFGPLLFHALVGVAIMRGIVPNTGNYPYAGNIRYMLQRVTGMIAMVFILYHVLQLHHYGKFLGENWGVFNGEHAAASAAAAITPWWVTVIYAVGMLSAVFHFANGIWTMGITWGVWITPGAMRRANWICGAVGLVLAVAGLGSLVGLHQVTPGAAAAAPTQTADEDEIQQPAASNEQTVGQTAAHSAR